MNLLSHLLIGIVLLPLPLVAFAFLASLALAMGASAWFTRRLETLCLALRLSPGVLSILGALGANIPNYAASISALAAGHGDVGLGIILGSNIYNIGIILGLSTFATPGRHGITLTRKEARDARTIASYSLAGMLVALLITALLPGSSLIAAPLSPLFVHVVLILACAFSLLLFAAFTFHIVRRPHVEDDRRGAIDTVSPVSRPQRASQRASRSQERSNWRAGMSLPVASLLARARSIAPLRSDGVRKGIVLTTGEALLALLLALGSVVVMVQSGQGLTGDLHMSPVLAGLLVLAVATSLPNTVVAVSLARTGMSAASVEELFSSNSVNAALGIAFPLLIWQTTLFDSLLQLLDAPLMVALTLAALVCVYTGRVSRRAGFVLLLAYALWVVARVML